MKKENLKSLFESLLSHAHEIKNDNGAECVAKWQRVTEEEVKNFKNDYKEIKCGELKLYQKVIDKGCFGILKEDVHYQLLNNVFFKVLGLILDGFEFEDIYIGEFEARFEFKNKDILNRAVNRISEFLTDYLVVRVTKDLQIVLYLGKSKYEDGEQILYD